MKKRYNQTKAMMLLGAVFGLVALLSTAAFEVAIPIAFGIATLGYLAAGVTYMKRYS